MQQHTYISDVCAYILVIEFISHRRKPLLALPYKSRFEYLATAYTQVLSRYRPKYIQVQFETVGEVWHNVSRCCDTVCTYIGINEFYYVHIAIEVLPYNVNTIFCNLKILFYYLQQSLLQRIFHKIDYLIAGRNMIWTDQKPILIRV